MQKIENRMAQVILIHLKLIEKNNVGTRRTKKSYSDCLIKKAYQLD